MADPSDNGSSGDSQERDLRPLLDLCGEPMEVGAFLELAVGITSALAELHGQNLTYQRLAPEMILIDISTGAVRLAGPFEGPAHAYPSAQEITLPYMSPEQTGRLNLAIDHRSDLYSLGVIFYQLLTGTLPCAALDALEWVHCHIAHAPRPIIELAPQVPPQLADIVMRLLAKNAHERYQTASGLQWDLERCLLQWREIGGIEPFPPGERDIPERLLIPQRLYGRDSDLASLMADFNGVVESGRPKLVLVAGYSGIGKSSLVRQLYRPVVLEHGYFVSGKFDQHQRNIPYATISQAFRELIRHILSESEERIARWKGEVTAAVGINGQLLVDLAPELVYLIGKQPPVPDLPPADAKNRLHMLLQRFVAVFARKEHPLVMFLDDLQWADIASLKAASYLVTHPGMRYLMVIGCYRSNEVSPSHPLMVELSALQEEEELVRTILLEPLPLQEVGHILSDTFAADEAKVEPLARLVHEKTGGNPFFIVQFVKGLHEEGVVWFDSGRRLWEWDIQAIGAKAYTDNVAGFMVGRLQKLPEKTLQEMRLAACIGNRFDLRTLAMISDLPEQEVGDSLADGVREGLLLAVDDGWIFLHDRIQEAAYSLVPEDERPALHLQIGRLMLAHLPEQELEERVLDVVNQLNRGEELVKGVGERERLAELNLMAAKRAKGGTAYATALYYLGIARRFLGDDGWMRRHPLAFEMELLQAECEFLTGELEQARGRLSHLSPRSRTLQEGSAVTCLTIDVVTTEDGREAAVDAGLAFLKRDGIEWSRHPSEDEVRQEFSKMWEALGQRSTQELLDLPLMADPDCAAVMDVLTRLLPPTLHTDGNLFSLLVCRMIHLSLQHGNSDGSCLAWVWLGLLIGPRFGDYAGGYHFGKLSLDLVEQRGLERYKARVYLEYYHVATPWNLPVRTAPALAQRALDAAAERGDLTFMAYASTNLVSALLSAGRPLAEVQEEAERRLEFATRARFGLIVDIITGQLGLLRLLRGLTPHFTNCDRPGCDDNAFEQRLEEEPGMAVARSWYWVRKLQGLFHTGDYPAAMVAAEKTREVLWTIPSHLEVMDYEFFAGLACCACYATAQASEQPRLLECAHRRLAQYREWEPLSPENFADRKALLGAEVARLEGRELEAERLYEKAIWMAREHGQLQNEALAYELASRFYRVRGFQTFADSYLRLAISRYQRWGAEGKARQLEEHAPWRHTGFGESPVASLDAVTLVKASQAISQEIILPDLLNTLMRMVLQNAGAQKGVLLLLRGDELYAAAKAGVEEEHYGVLLDPPTPPAELVPLSIVNYVRRTRQSVILDDARVSDLLPADPYAEKNQPVSVLCLPVTRQAETVGVLYLENNLVKGAFTAERVTVLEALASQAAISLENSKLYAALQESELKYRELSGSLEVRVSEAVEEVGEKNRMLVLQSRQAVMGEMLGNIAHQWRQPLNSLGLLAQELQMSMKFKTLTNELLESNVKKTMEIIRHMSKTIDDFRYFFKPEKEKVHFRLREILDKALSLLEGTFHAHGIRVETVTAGDPVLEGYPNEYSQVLLNILNNAKDAMIARAIADPRITITVGTERGRSVVTIADNAGGVTPEIIEKIFDLYFTTKGPEHGTGVGLFMSKNIIEKNMGGSLTVRNTGAGAEFRIEV